MTRLDSTIAMEEPSRVRRLKEYDDWHEQIGTHEDKTEAPSHPWHQTVMKLLPDLNGQRVLEIGCGRGDFSIWLSQQFPDAEIVAIDFSAKAISIAESRAVLAGSKARFVVNDAEALSFDDQEFDFLVSCECFEHVPNPASMAAEMCRVLKPAAKFILTTENYFNGMLLAWVISWLRKIPFNSGSGVQPYENFFLFWRVKALLESGGLKVTHMESNHFQWLLLPRTDPMRLATTDFASPRLKRLFRPFGRHFTFCGHRVSAAGS